jgi:hypothetical protein
VGVEGEFFGELLRGSSSGSSSHGAQDSGQRPENVQGRARVRSRLGQGLAAALWWRGEPQAGHHRLARSTVRDDVDAQISTQDAQISAAQAQVGQAQANQDLAKVTWGRDQPLVKQGWATAQQGTTDIQNLKAQQATVDSAQASLKVAQRQIDSLRAQRASQEASLAQANAQLDQANLNLSYTTVTADQPGCVVNLSGAVGAQAVFAFPIQASLPPCGRDASAAAAPRDRTDTRPGHGARRRLRSCLHRVANVVAKPLNADPLIHAVRPRRDGFGGKAIRRHRGLPPLLEKQPGDRESVGIKKGGKFVNGIHFIAAGGPIGSMLALMSYTKGSAG